MAVDDRQEASGGVQVFEPAVEEGLGVALDRSERRAQLVRDIGNKVSPHRLQPSELSEVMEDQHIPTHRRPVFTNLHRAHRQVPLFLTVELELAGHWRVARPFVRNPPQQFLQLGVAGKRLEWFAAPVLSGAQAKELLRRAVIQHDVADRIDHHHPLGHTLQHDFELLALAL